VKITSPVRQSVEKKSHQNGTAEECGVNPKVKEGNILAIKRLLEGRNSWGRIKEKDENEDTKGLGGKWGSGSSRCPNVPGAGKPFLYQLVKNRGKLATVKNNHS